MRSGNHRKRPWRHGIEQLAAGDEHDARAGDREQPAREPRIDLEIMAATFDRAERDRVDHQPRFQARLDREQPTDFSKHARTPNG
jgi:hypothetical protein